MRDDVAAAELMQIVREEMLPLDRNYFRRAASLEASLGRLDASWRMVSDHVRGTGAEAVKAREAAALIATSRWAYRSALVRAESRGMHRRSDQPASRPGFRLPVRGERARKRRCRASGDTLDHSGMIEIVSARRCIECDICVRVCPANVFDARPEAPPVIARQNDCQTCFLCEIYCPTDALYVAPDAEGPTAICEAEVEAKGLFGSYARALGWRRGKPGGADKDPTFRLRVAPR